MICRDDHAAARRNVMRVAPTHAPKYARNNGDDEPADINSPLRHHRRIGPDAVGLRSAFDTVSKTHGWSACKSMEAFLGPRLRHLCLTQSIVVPAFTFRAEEATVTNRVSFGQTDLVFGAAFIAGAAPLDFNYQDLARKIEFRILPGHVTSFCL